jgi:hypothetical protein
VTSVQSLRTAPFALFARSNATSAGCETLNSVKRLYSVVPSPFRMMPRTAPMRWYSIVGSSVSCVCVAMRMLTMSNTVCTWLSWPKRADALHFLRVDRVVDLVVRHGQVAHGALLLRHRGSRAAARRSG